MWCIRCDRRPAATVKQASASPTPVRNPLIVRANAIGFLRSRHDGLKRFVRAPRPTFSVIITPFFASPATYFLAGAPKSKQKERLGVAPRPGIAWKNLIRKVSAPACVLGRHTPLHERSCSWVVLAGHRRGAAATLRSASNQPIQGSRRTVDWRFGGLRLGEL